MYSRKSVAVFMFRVAKKTQGVYRKKDETVFSALNKVFPKLKKLKYGFYTKGNVRNYKYFSEKSSSSSLVLGIASCFLKRIGIESEISVIHHYRLGTRKKLYLILGCPYPKKISKTAIYAMRLAMGVFREVMIGKEIDDERRTERLRKLFRTEDLPVKTLLILKEAEKRKIPFTHLAGKSLFQLGLGRNQVRLDSSNINSVVATRLANHKDYFKELFKKIGGMIPEGSRVYSSNEATIVAEKLGYPVVFKPCAGTFGQGVINVADSKEIVPAFNEAKKHGSGVIVEKFIEGRDYRVTLVDNKVVAATRRIPARVRGDGKHIIQELIEIENKSSARLEKAETPLKKIKIGKDTNKVLKKQGLTLKSIPKKNQIAYVRANANISTGGESIDVTSRVHPKTARILSFATRVMGIQMTGVDIICSDISKELERGRWALIEMNARPDIDMHHYPFKGKKRNVAGMILDMLFRGKKKTGIPVWAITGTNGKTTTTRMIAYILEGLKKTVGFTTTGNLSVGDAQIYNIGSGASSARALLLDPKVQLAVIEVAHLGIITSGLGYKSSDVTVITNLKEDHIGERVKGLEHPEFIKDINDLYKIKSVVARQTRRRGVLVLNADDDRVVKMGKGSKAEKLYFSMKDDNQAVLSHLKAGGRAVYLRKDGMIMYKTKDKETEVIKANIIPATEKGTVKHNVANVLAAIAATLGSKCTDIPLKVIRETLGNFESSFALNPGRMNVVDCPNFKVIIDYAHNPEGFQNIFNAIEHIPCKRRVGVIKSAGDRPNDFVVELGEMAGKFFDKIYVKDPSKEKLRERKTGEISKLLKRGVLKSGFSEDKVVVEVDEIKAVKRALKDAKKDDLIVIFAHDIDNVYKLVEKCKKRRSSSIK